MRIFREISRFTKKEIDQLFAIAKPVVRCAHFVLLRAAKVNEFGHLLPIVSKKVGNACMRNRIKRQLKSIFFTHKAYLQGFDYAIIVKPATANIPFAQLEALFLKGLQK